MADLAAWWNDLRPETRRRLTADPHGPVSSELWSEVTQHGVAVAGAYWPSVTEGPDGYRLPSEAAEFVENQSGS